MRGAAPCFCFASNRITYPGRRLATLSRFGNFYSLGLALRVVLCHAQREGGGGRTAIGKREKRLSFLYSCANVNARQSVVIVRKDCYQSNRASSGLPCRHVSRSERYHEFAPPASSASVKGLSGLLLPWAHPPRLNWRNCTPSASGTFIVSAVTRHPLPLSWSWFATSMNGDYFGDCCRKGYF